MNSKISGDICTEKTVEDHDMKLMGHFLLKAWGRGKAERRFKDEEDQLPRVRDCFG